jgi:hypothetical protein
MGKRSSTGRVRMGCRRRVRRKGFLHWATFLVEVMRVSLRSLSYRETRKRHRKRSDTRLRHLCKFHLRNGPHNNRSSDLSKPVCHILPDNILRNRCIQWDHNLPLRIQRHLGAYRTYKAWIRMDNHSIISKRSQDCPYSNRHKVVLQSKARLT